MAKRDALLLLALVAGVVLVATQGKKVAGMLSDRARALIHRLEGLRLTAYQDVAGLWTIGYGHLVKPGERFHPYGPVMTITQEEADALYAADSADARAAVASLVKVPLTDGQRTALESLVFNIGRGAFAGSTLLRQLNAGDYAAAAAQFPVWNRAGNKVVAGLSNRRAIEQGVFLS